MVKRDITSLRSALRFLASRDELLVLDRPVDPSLEVVGIIKALDGGYVLLFDNIQRFPDARIMGGLFSRVDRICDLFGVQDARALKLRALESIKSPMVSRVVTGAPCQETIRTDDLRVSSTIPMPQHTAGDPGPIVSGGVVLISEPGHGQCISYKRVCFRGNDWASLQCAPGSHADDIVRRYAQTKKKLPLTINISPPPAVMAVAGGGFVHSGIPTGADELAIAGALQGAPIELCKAVSGDAYSIAQAECVIEGYLDTSETVWESASKDPSAPFFPEFHGYLGRSTTTYKFQATAVTQRGDRPIYHCGLGHCLESACMHNFTSKPLQFALLSKRFPDLIRDVNGLNAMKGRFGLVIQVTKLNERDDEKIREVITAAFEDLSSMKLVVVVDEDVDIYNAEEVMWAMCTRVNPDRGLVLVPPTSGPTGIRKETIGPFAAVTRMGFDASVPFNCKDAYYRGEYPKVNLEKWLTPQQIDKARSKQGEYARLLADKRV